MLSGYFCILYTFCCILSTFYAQKERQNSQFQSSDLWLFFTKMNINSFKHSKKAFFPQSATKNRHKKQLTNYKKGELLLINDNKQYPSAREIWFDACRSYAGLQTYCAYNKKYPLPYNLFLKSYKIVLKKRPFSLNCLLKNLLKVL